MPDPGPPPPELPERVEPEALRELDDEALGGVGEGLRAAEREVAAAMAPFEKLLRELRARGGELATEQRRRDRARHLAARVAVREQAGSGEMPPLADVLAAPRSPLPEATRLAELRCFLRTGGQVGLGFPTRPGSLAVTDGRRSQQVQTLAEARARYADGWEPGTPGLPGVRVHLVGTRVERVVPAEDVVVDVSGGG